ncbi:dihydropteroate synthase [Frigidibacter sp. RF13]|uniref:dihydropteroate synthase n=1 Tax=Frigidibacter sp. RF13 TaxID=2997340 RepID=UPI00226D807B|nr:dihydropteroate synthase [Frigidibacter sp. RF13]MCY1127752.1 dihydropteroate synthase [Frigidibacter sp. RF13]
MIRYRPIAQTDVARPKDALPLAGGWCWFDRVEVLTRAGSQGLLPARELPSGIADRLTTVRPPIVGLTMDAPRLMGILNVTPDSFSDGGRFADDEAALAQASLLAEHSDILDIGGESTRPGAAEVDPAEECARTAPLIAALRQGGLATPISIDTRKSTVAQAAIAAGASMVNDVAALTYDPALGPLVAAARLPVCLMHAQGAPATMQADPRYDDVLLDVYDYLEGRVAAAEATGIARDRIIVDPGIGFGKTVAHNLALIRGLSLFHGLGCPILLGASRKRFIGEVGEAPDTDRRGPGTIAVTLAGIAQGVQFHRVHDSAEARQAVRLWMAAAQG